MMVKAPRARHSKGDKQPVTIDLGADDVTRMEDRADEPEFAPSGTERKPEASGEDAPSETAKTEREEVGAQTRSAEERTEAEAADSPSPARNEPPVPPPNDPPLPSGSSPRRAGIGSAFAAGVAGGVIALLIAGGLQWAGLIPELTGKNAADQKLTAMESQIAVLKQDVAALESAPPDSGIASLEQQLDQADQKISQQAAALDQLRSTVAKNSAGESQAAASQVKDIETRLSQIEKAAAANASGEAGLTALNVKFAGQEKTVGANGQALASQSERIGKLEQSLGDLSQKVAANAEQPKVALAIAASALKSAIDRGTPFVSELDTYASLAPESPEIDTLRELAPSGVPTREEIVAEVGGAADAMVKAGRPAEQSGGGIFSDLVDSARSLVKVRPVGAIAGNGVGATVARIEVEIKAGDLAKAVQEYQTLPQGVQEAGSVFFARVQTHLQAEDLVQKTLASALKAR